MYQAAANAASALLSTHESSELSINDPSDSTNAAKAAAKAERKQIKKADKISAWMEATQIAGFSAKEADGFFGAPDHSLINGLKIDLRAPKAARQAYIDRHSDLLDEL